MIPVLFKIGIFELHSWGVSFGITLALSIWVAVKRGRRLGINVDTMMAISTVILIASVVGSRFWYVVCHLSSFRGHWIDTINPFHRGSFGIAGFSMVGGVILAIFAAFCYIKVKKISFTFLGDVLAPSFLLGVGIQRLGGCFLNGCCFGKPTHHFLGVVFPINSVAGSLFPGQPLWPAQLFASALGFLGFGLILWLSKKYDFRGSTLWLVFIYYPVARFLVDQFRYYESEQILLQTGWVTININHILLGVLFIVGVIFWFSGWMKRQNVVH